MGENLRRYVDNRNCTPRAWLYNQLDSRDSESLYSLYDYKIRVRIEWEVDLKKQI